MKIFRSISLCIGMALSRFADAIDSISRMIEPLVSYVTAGCEAMACGVAKLKRELVHNANREIGVGEGISSGFRRESHGFRQSTAGTMPMQLATT